MVFVNWIWFISIVDIFMHDMRPGDSFKCIMVGISSVPPPSSWFRGARVLFLRSHNSLWFGTFMNQKTYNLLLYSTQIWILIRIFFCMRNIIFILMFLIQYIKLGFGWNLIQWCPIAIARAYKKNSNCDICGSCKLHVVANLSNSVLLNPLPWKQIWILISNYGEKTFIF